MNLNHFAKKITLAEGGKVNLSVAQIKEVTRLIAIELYNTPTTYLSLWKLGRDHEKKAKLKKGRKKK